MDMFALMFAANTQQIDQIGPIVKMLLPFLVLAAILKVTILFMPKKRCHHQHQKAPEKAKTIRNKNLIPCPDCDGLISHNARVCPHCGAPINANYIKAIEEKRNKARRAEKVVRFLFRMIMAMFLGLFILSAPLHLDLV